MRIRDLERRKLQRYGWRARYRVRTGDWVWDNHRRGLFAFDRRTAYNRFVLAVERSANR